MRSRALAKFLSGSALASVLIISQPATAQSIEDAGGVQEIIVTAQKRDQSIQDVPVAVTALDENALVANRVESVADLTGLAPGLVTRRSPGGQGVPNFVMRGVLATGNVPSKDRQVSMYLDGVYLGGSRGLIADLADVERIEVLRGPQGTLFGRNATAGAIQIVTRKPKGEFAFRQDVSVGNRAAIRTRTTVDTPSFGPFSAYATYVHDERRGDVRNLGVGVAFDRSNPFNDVGAQASPRWLGGKNFESVFAALRFDDGGDFTLTYKFDWLKGKFSQEARTVSVLNNGNLVGGMLQAIVNAQPMGGGAYGPVTLNPADRRPDAYNNSWTSWGDQSVQGHNLTAEWRASDSLSFKNIFAYRKARVYSPATVAGLDGLEFTSGAVPAYARFAAISALGAGFFTRPPAEQQAIVDQYAAGLQQAVGLYFAGYGGQQSGNSWQVSNELQANYQRDWLTITAGVLYYRGSDTGGGLPGFRPNFAFQPVPFQLPLGQISRGTGKTRSLAAYAQTEVKITRQLELVLGGRITQDKKNGQDESGGTFVGTRVEGEIVGTNILPFKFKKSKPTYAIGLNFKPNDDILLYGKYSTAFLSGGAVADLIFPPETAVSWEFGVKSDLFDRLIRFNLAAYHAEYKNAQAILSGTAINRPDLSVAVISNGKLKAKGIEVDIDVSPALGLTFGGTMGYTDTTLIDPDPAFAQGKTLKQGSIPKWAGSGYVSYITQPLFADATLLLRMDATYQDKTRVISDVNIATNIPAFAPYEFQPAKTIVNARVALRDIRAGNGRLEAGIWAKNLFNSRKPLYPFQFGDFLVTSSFEPARTYGIDLTFKY